MPRIECERQLGRPGLSRGTFIVRKSSTTAGEFIRIFVLIGFVLWWEEAKSYPEFVFSRISEFELKILELKRLDS